MLDEWAVTLFLGLKGVFYAVAFIFVISGIDEFFIDICYFTRKIYRILFIRTRHKRLTEAQLLAKPEQAIAMMLPCWDESAVIRRMLENTLTTMNYSNYVIFVGTYPNDPATQREVDLVRERFDNVERIVTPKDGPTSKADCLNWLYKGIQVFEEDHGKKFDIFLMEDSEDILHPLLLKLCNYVIPTLDMIQLPVHPMARKWTDFTGNHYMDEFAETHTRDIVVREALTGAIPSAGVGTGFSRQGLKNMAAAKKHLLFDINSLTEDYDFGLKAKEFGLKQGFVRQWIWRPKMVKSIFTGKPKEKQVREYISIKEFFPNTMKTAIRQKTRWVMGIALQGWTTVGWRGNLAFRYMLVRDRKPIITNLANFIGNILFLIILSLFAYNVITEQYRLPPLVDDTPLSIALVSACLFFLFLRIFMRIMVVYITYGWYQSLLAVPRLFWANVINFIATNRAIFIYTKTKITGQKATWDKTAHVYPSEDELRAYRRKLGDLLLDRRFLTIEQLDNALAAQKKSKKRLGEILIEQGLITEDQLIQALGVQFTVATQEIDPYQTPMQVLELVPVSLAYKYTVYPLSLSNGQLTVASNEMLDEKTLHALEKEINQSITLRLATKSDISFAIRKGYARQNDLEDASLLGKKLVEANEITLEQLQSALKEQRSRYTSLGDILLLQKAITKEQLVEADKEYLGQEQAKKIGEFLVDKGYIRSEQLSAALEEQKKRSPMLGEVLLEQEAIQQENLKRFLSV